ncbi:helix-turn-helix transcriptional regulator [Longivirga aurantiaca]|uniref:LuxR C-terminal-related transcriptional regulator n=1 Tax=Longivirga aurantiaca TaxID=1837743 RepID=A0ABW1SXM6_9ACTN
MTDTTVQSAPGPTGVGPVTLVVVADIALVRVSVASLMTDAAGMDVVATVAPDDLPAFLARNPDSLPDAVLLGLTSDSSHSTVKQVASAVRSTHPAPALLVIGPRRNGLARALLEHGPERVAFLLDSNVRDAETLAHVTRTVLRGVSAFDPEIVAGVNGGAPDDGLGRLTPREHQVLEALARGLTNAAIADELGITVKSVEANVTKVFRKLELRDGAKYDRRVLAALAFHV